MGHLYRFGGATSQGEDVMKDRNEAQISNLLYGEFPIRGSRDCSMGARPEAGETAGWKPALPRCSRL
jgi:hypothetical protein